MPRGHRTAAVESSKAVLPQKVQGFWNFGRGLNPGANDIVLRSRQADLWGNFFMHRYLTPGVRCFQLPLSLSQDLFGSYSGAQHKVMMLPQTQFYQTCNPTTSNFNNTSNSLLELPRTPISLQSFHCFNLVVYFSTIGNFNRQNVK
jgi:hypothetical protein